MKKQKIEKHVNRYTPTFDYGLNDEQISERISQGLNNVVKDVNKKGYLHIVLKNSLTFFNMIYLIIALLLIVVETPLTEFTFLALVLLNTGIGIVQEIRSKRSIDKLSLLSAPSVTVVRNGKKSEVGVSDIVLDDIMFLSPGREITTDAILVSGEVEVNESQLTGESVPIKKHVGDTLFSGSFIVSGNCYAQVERIGNDNEIAKLAAQAKSYKKPKSGILGSLNRMLQVVAVILLISAVLLFLRNYDFDFANLGERLKDKDEFSKAVQTTTTALVGMIPQGLYLMTTVALAVSVRRLAGKKTLVQDIYCIEMLARVDVLCLDKTGTITDGTMSVVRYIEHHRSAQFNIEDIVAGMNSALKESNSTSKALENYFGFNDKLKPLEVTPFSSDRKFSAVTYDTGTFIIGAPEFVLKGQVEKYAVEINEYANQGFRVLALAHSLLPLRDGKLQKSPRLLALILIEDQIRKEAFETIKYFKDNGVQVKVISGDNPVTVAEVARRVGIRHTDEYISLDGLSDEEVYDAATKYTVFGRVKPKQKQIIVKALKDAKHTVAMTGDGVNDILALKEADCSIAMASGSDAVRSVASLVLLDSNFANMPRVVGEGRRVINNIQQTAILFLVKTLFVIILTVLTISGFIGKFHPTGNSGFPIENKMSLFLLEFFAIGIPALFLALQPNNNLIKGNFLVNAIKKAFPGALAIIIEIIIVYMVSVPLTIDPDQLTTIVVLCATYTAFMMLYIACSPFTFKKFLLFVTCIGISLFITICSMYSISPLGFDIRKAFGLVELFKHQELSDGTVKNLANPLLLFIILALLSYTFITSISYFISLIDKKLEKRLPKRKKKKNDDDDYNYGVN